MSVVRLGRPRDGAGAGANVDLEAEADHARCGALRDFWYVACLSSELPARRPIARTILGVPMVLFRGPDGAPAALRDRCLHRNAALSHGEVFDGKLGCPYHGWTYDTRGEVVEIPSLAPGAACEQGRLASFAALEQDGLVFVLPAGGDPARARRPAFRTPHHGERGWTSYYMVTRFANGVTNLVENFMDVPHTVFVHRGWFRNPARKRVPATVVRRDGEVLVTYLQDRDAVSGLGRLFNPRGTDAMTHTDRFVSPNVTRVDYAFGERGAGGGSGFTITSQCTPVGATETLVYTSIAYRLPLGRIFKPLVRWYTRQVIEQDVKIMAIQKEGLLNGPGGGVFASTEADVPHGDIEAYRAWLRDGATEPGPGDLSRTIEFWI